jgi:peptide/nickel transport system substrate-binding protein
MARETVDRRRFIQLAGTAAGAAALAGCAGGDGGDGTTTSGDTETETETDMETTTSGDGDGGDMESLSLVVTQGAMDSGMDPQDHSETPTDNIVRQAYEGLMDRDKTGGIVEGLATEWERVEQGTVRFTLRDASFHNGDPLTAEDVAFSLRRIADPEVGIQSTQAGDLGGPSSIEAGDGTVTVNYEQLNPIAFQLFATNGDIMQRSWVEENSRDFINQNANGTGPFQVTGYEGGEEVVYERNGEYWDGAPDVTDLTFNSADEPSTRVNALLQGETDLTVNVIPEEIPRIQGSDAAEVRPVASTRVIFCYMRFDVEPFTSQQFRQAMNYAVDVQSIIDSVLQTFGTPVGQPTLEPFTGYNPDIDPYPVDTDRAEQLVEESGFSGVEIELQTPQGRYLKDVEIAQAVSSQIDSLSNVSCTLQQRDFNSLVQDLTTGQIEDKPPFSLLGWGNGEFDAAQTIGPLLTSSGSLSTFMNEEIDGLIADANTESDPDTRVSLLQEANQRLHDLAPWVFLHRQFSVYGVNTDIAWEPRADEAIDVVSMSRQ